MPGSSNFKVFNESFLEAQSDGEYLGETQRVSGLTNGIAKTKMHNKLFRQVSIMVAAIAQFIANQGAVVSDGDLAALVSVIQDSFETPVGAQDKVDVVQGNLVTHSEVSASETVNAHVELATADETTAGTDNTKAVHPAGVKAVTDLLIPFTQKGVANGIPTLDSSGKIVQTASVFLPEYNSGSIDLSNIPTNQIWKLSNYLTNQFQMKIGSTKYYVDLLSMLTAYPSSGFFSYIGDLYYANTFPKGYTPTLGAQGGGVLNTLTLNADRMTMFVSVPSSGGSASVKVSFGNYDISLVKRIDVTMRVASTSYMASDALRIICIPVLETSNMGVAPSYYQQTGVGASYVTISYDVSAFLGIAEIYLLLLESYSSSGGTYSIAIDVSRVTLVAM